jgi:signal transduction histidine kinase
MRRGSLRLRLLLAGAISVLGALALSSIGLTLLFERHVERRVETELATYLNQLLAGLDGGTDGELAVEAGPADPRFEQPLSGLYWQVQSGDTLLRSRSLWDAELSLPSDELAEGTVHHHRIDGPAGVKLLAAERSVALPARLGGGTVRAVAAVDAAEISVAARAFAADLLPYLAVLATVLIAAAYAQVIVGLRPLVAVRERLSAIREGRARRLTEEPDAFPQEILPLTTEIDALIAAREAEAERARARAADLAHGLKTPLQALAGDIERLRQKGESALAMEIEQVATAMQRHVDRELARARLMTNRTDARADVRKTVERVLAVLLRTPSGEALDWRVDIPDGLHARIEADDLAEALGNLLENAARHARRQVTVRAGRDGELLTISVADDGPGIPPDQLEKALVRGGRLDQAGGGAGLGLAIVQDIAAAWAGRLQVRSSNSGLEAELRFPAHHADHDPIHALPPAP